MKTNIFVLSSPRETPDPWEYLKATLAEIDRQEPNCYRAVIVDTVVGYQPRIGERGGWDILRHPTQAGATGNRDPWWTLFSAALSLPGDALCFEDDIRICPGGIKRMLEFKVPGDLVGVKFFTPKPQRVSNKVGLHRLPWNAKKSASALFLQATKFSHSGIAAIEPFRYHPDYQQTQAADKCLGYACDALGLSIGQHVPDLVEHIGDVSKATQRRALPWWAKSSDFDAQLNLQRLDASLYG